MPVLPQTRLGRNANLGYALYFARQYDQALEGLASFDSQQSRIVELKFFGGLSIEETAEVIGISPATAKREWALAKSWLFRELSK
ncbi:MAG: ECF-type sigma factor [Acidobacteriota bacterium]